MNPSSTCVQLRPQLKRTIQKQIQKQSQMSCNSVPDGTGRDTSCGPTFSELMGVCREVRLTDMRTNGSILKLMLKQGSSRELEAAIRGLPLVIEDCTSLRPLWTAKQRDGRRICEDVFGQAVQAWYQSQKPKPVKKQAVWAPKEAGQDPQPLDFSRFTGDAA